MCGILLKLFLYSDFPCTFVWDGLSAATAVGFGLQLCKREQETEDHVCSESTLKNLKDVSAIVWDCPLSQITPIFMSWAVQVVKITLVDCLHCLYFLKEEERESQDPSQSIQLLYITHSLQLSVLVAWGLWAQGEIRVWAREDKGKGSIYKAGHHSCWVRLFSAAFGGRSYHAPVGNLLPTIYKETQ